MNSAIIKEPLAVYVIKSPEFEYGQEIAESIYEHIYRGNKEIDTVRSQVPVYYADGGNLSENQLKIDFYNAEKIAIVILIDKTMYLSGNHSVWDKYFQEIMVHVSDKIKVFPVAFKEKTICEFNCLKKINFIRAYSDNNSIDYDYAIRIINRKIINEVCRMLCDTVCQNTYSKQAGNFKVKIFLSHTKKDDLGEKLAMKVEAYIKNETSGVDDFFDSRDIPPGLQFEQVINDNINSSNILLVIQTDKYSDSEYCRKEVIIAKQYDIPLLVVDCICDGEQRIFPYIGNARHIKLDYNSADFAQQIVDKALEIVLEKESHMRVVESFVKQFYLNKGDLIFAAVKNAPELLTLSDIDHNYVKVYPEPPIGKTEYEVIKRFLSSVVLNDKSSNRGKFITPVRMLAACEDLDLGDRKIAISISDGNDNKLDGLNINHLRALSIELARYLICYNASVIYGGDINYNINKNFTVALMNVFHKYNLDSNNENKKYLCNYLAYYLSEKVSPEDEENMRPDIHIRRIERGEDGTPAGDLSKMRMKMTEDMYARVIVGGKLKGYSGKHPGVLEELYFALEKKEMTPVYLVGAFGGAAGEAVKCINRQKHDFTYPELEEVLTSWEVLKNGLNRDENERLFYSKNINEIISLILRGLQASIRRGKDERGH